MIERCVLEYVHQRISSLNEWCVSLFILFYFIFPDWQIWGLLFSISTSKYLDGSFRDDFRLWNTCTGSLDIFTIFSLPRNEHVQLLPLAQKKHTKSLNMSLFSLISSDASIFFNILFRSFSFPYLYMQ